MAIEALRQEPKKGHWKDESGSWLIKEQCDQCGELVYESEYKYCPYCGSYNGGDESD